MERMTLSRMSITLPAEPLEAVVERANSDNEIRSALAIKALAAYLELSSIREPYRRILPKYDCVRN
jgi:hypothetical protein